ncbi:AAA family ATPase [Absicoccus porci]|uniref:AAA family ATPase n=1 Tax=Absicoccus porci TaxID=2486576 RepID=UPI003F8ADD3B
MEDLKELLKYIDPSKLDYNGWIQVGMALKHEGYYCSDWDEWSRLDTGRYHDGECFLKWDSFNEESMGIVTGGTIVHMAQEQGWMPQRKNDDDRGTPLDWDSLISADSTPVIDTAWVEREPLTEPKTWRPHEDLIKYLSALFESDEMVGYVNESFQADNGRYIPKGKGHYGRTAGELISELERYKNVEDVIGTTDPEGGAWIRFNPLDGNGVRDINVTSYRYALVECDELDIAKQNALIRELELPVAAMVYSGKKSIHAVVKVNASNYHEYKDRVNTLFDICKKNGLNIDTQNKNPSRLSRMPGVMRGDKKQYLIDTNIGKSDWDEWMQWYKSQLDDLPECVELKDVFYDPPELAPVQIDGILRRGHKMLIAGPSKAGKTFLEIELAIATAEGTTWCGYQCRQGRVLFINLEVDEASFIHRIKDVYEGMNVKPDNLDNIVTLNLRGISRPLDKLAPILVNRIKKTKVDMVILDPIYKVITGDENSASDMANFCNQFDYICNETGVSMVYCHHHSKGNKSNMNAMDRASGSGVFARDPDAILDLLEVKTPLDVYINDPQTTAWKLEFTLREFAKPQPTYMYFTYPVHTIDTENTIVQANEKPEKDKKSKSEKKIEIFDDYVLSCEEPPTIAQISEEFGVTRPTVYSWIEKSKHVKKQDKKLIYELE